MIERDWKAETKDLEEAFDIISDKLVKADAEIEKLKQIIAKLRRIRASQFSDLELRLILFALRRAAYSVFGDAGLCKSLLGEFQGELDTRIKERVKSQERAE